MTTKAGSMPTWTDSVIWWQVFPLGFTDAEKSALPADAPVTHRLPQLIEWLDYLIELGCNGLALNPIFAAETHGYDIVDHFAVDSRLGDDADIDALIAACHQRGVRVLFDGVFNHVGRAFPGFADVLEQREKSAWAQWFHIDWDADGYDGFGYRSFEGHGGLVALNHDLPAVADYVESVMLHWLDRGIDGWRLDAAYAVPLEFWRRVTDRVREKYPDAWFVGEVIHGDFPEFVEQGGLDSVTQYELWKSTWSSLNDGNFFELDWTLKRHLEFCQVFVPMTFIGNHDVTRIASQLTDPRLLPLALVVLFTVPGVPSIYYGDEQAFRGEKQDREGGDDVIRPAFPADPSGLADVGRPIYRLHQDLIGLRTRETWLSTAKIETMTLANQQLSFRAFDDGGHQLVVLLNSSDDEFEFPLEGGFQLLLDGHDQDQTHDGPDGTGAVVGAQGWAIVRPES